ncbi:MAG: MogA/MoaB family molybdenum cofactor biosynthesis protein [Anaerolineales bacterium]|jgi:molybdenum cofactor synthesis domain-containing protein|nr:MogA/MoaB family molybdenum cofactor biosynthesis protein [Anaerolineales bacterium]
MSIQIAILTVSDRSFTGEREDLSGPALRSEVESCGWQVGFVRIVPDEIGQIAETLAAWADSGQVDVILTTGGTGFGARDVTPEATRQVVERLTPGLEEAMRAASLKITPHAMLSRAVSGIRKAALIVNLPGSPRAALENFRVIGLVLPHAVELLREAQDAEQGHGSF